LTIKVLLATIWHRTRPLQWRIQGWWPLGFLRCHIILPTLSHYIIVILLSYCLVSRLNYSTAAAVDRQRCFEIIARPHGILFQFARAPVCWKRPHLALDLVMVDVIVSVRDLRHTRQFQSGIYYRPVYGSTGLCSNSVCAIFLLLLSFVIVSITACRPMKESRWFMHASSNSYAKLFARNVRFLSLAVVFNSYSFWCDLTPYTLLQQWMCDVRNWKTSRTAVT